MKSKSIFVKNTKALVEEFQQNQSGKAWGELYKRYAKRVYRFCLKMGLEKEDALDLRQDIMLNIYYQITTLNNVASFESWLFRMTHNTCVNFLKNKSKYKPEPLESQFLEGEAESLKSIRNNGKRVEANYTRMMAVLTSMPPETRRLLTLKYQENYSIKSLTEMFDLNESAVKMRLLRAKRQMQSSFRQPPKMVG